MMSEGARQVLLQCQYGFKYTTVIDIIGVENERAFSDAMSGSTGVICTGCEKDEDGHGTVVFASDVEKFLRRTGRVW